MKDTNTIDEMLIREAKTYLDGLHIDLSKYSIEVSHISHPLASVRFTSKESGATIYVDSCYYDETGILQADTHF